LARTGIDATFKPDASDEEEVTMTATQTPAPPRVSVERSSDHGWLLFAGILVMIGGILDVIWGIAAIDKANFFVANAHYVISDLRLWGWVTLFVGAALIAAAVGIFRGSRWAVWVGIVALSLNAITQMLSISAYPFWALALFAIDVLAVYGLIAHGLSSSD
jgi:hypothetical protein